VITDAASDADGKANYLGSVQPYAIYLPHGVRHRRKVPLTFLLHSSNQNHNQYAATTPNFVRAACEERHSICVTPLGRGPDGNYFGTAELDFWQVWHAVATQFHLDPNRTIIAGYSMGGTGSNQLVMEHPDLFARSITLAGGIGDVDSLVNLRWVPTYLAGGAEDELVPVTLQAGEANTLEQLGYRFRWIIVTAIDHVSYELADSFADAVRYMGQNAKRMLHPGRIDFTWTPSNTPPPTGVSVASPPGIGWTQRRFLGVTTTGAYWLHDLRARSKQVDGHIVARSGERPDRAVSPHATQTVDPTFAPDPAAITQQTWHRRQRPVKRPVITLHLRNVRSLAVLLRDAGFRHGTVGHLHVTTDGRTAIALGNRIHRFATGTHVIRFRA
jgi:pimeloyl-ACP methyl ester carboxylesterase